MLSLVLLLFLVIELVVLELREIKLTTLFGGHVSGYWEMETSQAARANESKSLWRNHVLMCDDVQEKQENKTVFLYLTPMTLFYIITL